MQNLTTKSIPFLLRFGMAWAIGAVIYFFAVAVTVYDGIPSLILQPFCAAGFSFVCVAFCAVVGLPLRLPLLRQVWHGNMILAALLCLRIRPQQAR
ncbi:MAG: hypothetical protein PHD76_09560 [Methylacidiphilales bacterium]|nr:hypothetical protein [Candidatus Methylacidiphilales bacterium]